MNWGVISNPKRHGSTLTSASSKKNPLSVALTGRYTKIWQKSCLSDQKKLHLTIMRNKYSEKICKSDFKNKKETCQGLLRNFRKQMQKETYKLELQSSARLNIKIRSDTPPTCIFNRPSSWPLHRLILKVRKVRTIRSLVRSLKFVYDYVC